MNIQMNWKSKLYEYDYLKIDNEDFEILDSKHMVMIILLINLILIFLAWLVMFSWYFEYLNFCELISLNCKYIKNNLVLKCCDEVLELRESLTLTFIIFQRKKMET